jgi:hypothetical protein
MTVQRHFDTITVTASQDLTGHQYKPVDLAGGVGVTSLLSVGILQNKPNTGEHATLAYRGQMKAYAGAAVVSGALIGVTASGFMITVTGSASVGYAKTTAASGDLFEFVGSFPADKIA